MPKAAQKKIPVKSKKPSSIPQVKNEKPAAEVEDVIKNINKKYGEGAITYGIPSRMKDVKRIPTGSFKLDIDLGGGIPRGRFIEISGAESSSKTTQVLHIIRNAQLMGLHCMLSDVEATTDGEYAEQIGADPSKLIYCNPASMEEAMQGILDAQKSGAVDLAVLDSYAAMSPNIEQDSLMDTTTRLGVPAMLMNEFCRKWQMNNNKLSREGREPMTLIVINQLREKIGVMYGDPEYSPGGNQKKFTASVILRLRKGDWLAPDKKSAPYGQVVKYKLMKNKLLGNRETTGSFDFYFAENNAGVFPGHNDNIKEAVICAIEYGIIRKSGSWYSYKDNRYQGVPDLAEALRQAPNSIEEMKKQILDIVAKKEG